jgi:Glycosyl transferase family 8
MCHIADSASDRKPFRAPGQAACAVRWTRFDPTTILLAARSRVALTIREGKKMGDANKLRKWYFATNRHGLLNAFDQIQVAVLSARRWISLSPICLVETGGDPAGVSHQLEWLRAQGVTLLPRQSSFLADLRARYGADMDVYSGHWLRCDIPTIERDEPFVLYTDIDVMFVGPIDDNQIWPRYIACCPEHEQDDKSYFNSGVMVMNINNLRDRLPDLMQTVKRRLDYSQPHDDQGALNELFRNASDWLPTTWNWKPYWGRNDDARIVHFHGPKPALVRHFLADRPADMSGELQRIFMRDPQGYAYYTERFYSVLIYALLRSGLSVPV